MQCLKGFINKHGSQKGKRQNAYTDSWFFFCQHWSLAALNLTSLFHTFFSHVWMDVVCTAIFGYAPSCWQTNTSCAKPPSPPRVLNPHTLLAVCHSHSRVVKCLPTHTWSPEQIAEELFKRFNHGGKRNTCLLLYSGNCIDFPPRDGEEQATICKCFGLHHWTIKYSPWVRQIIIIMIIMIKKSFVVCFIFTTSHSISD